METLRKIISSITNLIYSGKNLQKRIAVKGWIKEDKYRVIAENVEDWIYWVGPDKSLQYVSASSEKITGYAPEQFNDNPGLITEIIYPDDLSNAKLHYEKEHEARDSYEVEFRIIKKSGDQCWLSHTCRPVYTGEGEYLGRIITNRDITRHKNEEFLKQYNVGLDFLSSAAVRMLAPMGLSELFRLITDNLYSIAGGAIVAFSEFDLSDRKLIVRELRSSVEEREIMVKLLGCEPESLIFGFPDDIRSRMKRGGLDCLEGGFYDLVFGQMPESLCTAMEKELNIKSVFAMACAVEDDILGTVSILAHEKECMLQNKNLIESVVNQAALALKRRKAEDALRESEIRLSAFFDNAESIFWIKDLQGRFIAVNHYTADILGKAKEQILGKTVYDIHNKEFADQYSDNDRTVLVSGQSMIFEESTELSDGLHTMVSVKFPLFNSHNSIYAIGAICTDITERKLAELKLKEKNEEIEAQNEEYLQLNEELRQTNEELQIAKENAEQSDHLKTAFLQNMSHEIRTPMNAIMGFSQLLPEQYGNKEKLEHFSKIINQRCFDLLDIINDILDISKIESGQAPVHIENCKLALLLSEISIFFSEFQKRHNKQHIAFHIQLHPGLSNQEILTDKVKLKQILINLMGNALKFTNAGEIRLGCKPDGRHHLLFNVSDTGIGIPQDKKNFIFERFAQLEQTPHHLYGGTGLGLSIVKGLIDLLGGKIWVESELNKGSTFYFKLPYEKASDSSEAQTQVEIQEKLNFSNKTILIVEDDVYNAAYLKEILNGTGAKILHSVYAKDAIEIMKSGKPDIVLMDIRLPDMDGYTVTQLMKKHDPYLRIIAQTAYAANEDKERAIEVGCSDFISKPIKRDVLLSMIDKQLSGR